MLPKARIIHIIFCGQSYDTGSVDQREFNAWVNDQVEFGLMADVHGESIVVSSEDFASGEAWMACVRYMQERASEVDGFVVITELKQLLQTAAALSFMAQGLGKTIVCTSSAVQNEYESLDALVSDYGLRAHMLVALQASGAHLAEPVIVCGNRMIRGTRAMYISGQTVTSVQSFQSASLGVVDFGVHVASLGFHSSGTATPCPVYEPRIAVVDSLEQTPRIPEYTQGIIVRGPVTAEWLRGVPADLPVVVWGQNAIHDRRLIEAMHLTWETALVKFAWVLGQVTDIPHVRSMMHENFVGENG